MRIRQKIATNLAKSGGIARNFYLVDKLAENVYIRQQFLGESFL